jgi:hypothetical protein
MEHNEIQAHKLFAKLTKAGISARIEGGGLHWNVEAASKDGRSLSVDCFWYERNIHGLILGMNPLNARSRLHKKQRPRQGAEFYVILKEDGKRIADGRTPNRRQVVKCACSWFSGATLEVLVIETPFIDEKRRAMQSVASRIDPRLTWEIEGDPAYDLWVYGAQRSCRIRDESCALFIGQAQVAFRDYAMDPISDVSAWLIDAVPVSSLAERGVLIERHAEVLENDPARWHWLHVCDRIEDPSDVLFPLAPLISALADNPIASKFYTYSSLNRLCFSASSHFPWVGDFPMVVFAGDNVYDIAGARCSLQQAIAKIESLLSESPVKPFFGSKPDHDVHILQRIFADQGSSLRPMLVRRGQWSDVYVAKELRQCILSSDFITCIEQSREFNAACVTANDVVRIAIRFLEQQASFDELDTLPGIMR